MISKLALVDDPVQISASHENFRRGLTRDADRALDMVRRTHYWVYDPSTRTFSPSKFSGYVAMDFPRYRAAYAGQLRGARFQGTLSRQAITHALGEDYQADADLTLELEAWIALMLGPDALMGIDRGKWRFVRLPTVGVGGLAALAGGWEGSDELVDALSEARRSPGGTPPDLG